MALERRARGAAAGRRAGEGGVDPRGGHPARHLPAGLPRHDLGEPRGRQGRRPGNTRSPGHRIMARWLPPAFQKGIDVDAVDSAVDMPYDIPDFQVRIRTRRAAGARADRLLARRRAQQQRLRHRVLHGRAGAKGRQGPDRVPARHAGQDTRGCWRRSTWWRRNRTGATPLPPRAGRGRLGAAVVRQLHRHGGGGGGGRGTAKCVCAGSPPRSTPASR